MEKKNTILLTVIAIATLLVAVVGATFAYFTASVSTDPATKDKNNVSFTSAALTSAVMEYGNTVPTGTDPVYPGYKAVKTLTIKKTCTDTNGCQDIKSKIVVTSALNGNTDITWKLYKVDSASAITCTTDPKDERGADGIVKYWDNGSCTGIPTDSSAVVLSSDDTHTGNEYTYSVPTTATISNGETLSYYALVVDYANDPDAAQTGQGQTFSVSIDYQAEDSTVAQP